MRLAFSKDEGRTFSPAVMASGELDDNNHPFLSMGEDQRLSLVFQARAHQENGEWSNLQPFVARVGEDGRVSQPAGVPTGGESGSRPHAATASGGRIFVAWSNSGKRAVELARGRLLP